MKRTIAIVIAFCAFAVVAPFATYFVINPLFDRTYEADTFSEMNEQLWMMRKKQISASDIPYPYNINVEEEGNRLWRYSILGEQFVIVYSEETGKVVQRLPVYE